MYRVTKIRVVPTSCFGGFIFHLLYLPQSFIYICPDQSSMSKKFHKILTCHQGNHSRMFFRDILYIILIGTFSACLFGNWVNRCLLTQMKWSVGITSTWNLHTIPGIYCAAFAEAKVARNVQQLCPICRPTTFHHFFASPCSIKGKPVRTWASEALSIVLNTVTLVINSSTLVRSLVPSYVALQFERLRLEALQRSTFLLQTPYAQIDLNITLYIVILFSNDNWDLEPMSQVY